jgi:peptidoglycan/LPS O-acetylase OafA/YrhL
VNGDSRHRASDLYRPDIDGLRCIAVLGVIFCHLKFSALPGGFVGVDVFFVISGYLISRNILNDLQAGRFSLLAFYDRRIRRIFPALFVTIAASFVAGLMLNSPEQLRILAGDVVSAVFSIVNIRFWRGAHDYFAASSDDRALLHLWSLSVEEQFYLVWPALLLLLVRLKSPKAQGAMMALLIAFSLGVAQLWLPRDPAAVFYLTPFRVFEFASGAIVVLAERRWAPPLRSSIVLVAGLSMIFIPMVIYTAATPFPGLTAMVPVLGAALVIYSRSHAAASVILSNSVAVGIGRVSYSLYLCHWPVIVFARQVNWNVTDGLLSKLAALVLMAVLAVALYRWVERPFRAAAPATAKRFWQLSAACAVLIAAVAVPAYVAFRQDGWSWRYDEARQELMRKQAFALAPCLDVNCVFGDVSGPLGVQIIGDSYAQQYVAALQPLLLKLGRRGESYAYGGCMMLKGLVMADNRAGADCAARREAALAKIRNSDAPVLVAQAWSSYRGVFHDDNGKPLAAESDQGRRDMIAGALSNTLATLGHPDRRILVSGGEVLTNCQKYGTEVSRFPLTQEECAAPVLTGVRKQTAGWNETLLKVTLPQPGQVQILRPEDYLCAQVCDVVNGGIWLYRDSGHWTVAGAELLSRRAYAPLMMFLTGDGSAERGRAAQER